MSRCTRVSVRAVEREKLSQRAQVRVSPLSVELERVENGWSLLPQVPQVNGVIVQGAHQCSLKRQTNRFYIHTTHFSFTDAI